MADSMPRSEADWLALPQRRPNLLVVSADPHLVLRLNERLGADHDLRHVGDAVTALRQCRAQAPDLVLFEFRAGPLAEFMRHLRRLADVPVLALIVAGDRPAQSIGLAAGVGDFVPLPAEDGVLELRVRNQLQLKFKTDGLLRLSPRDGLTGVANRRHFDEMLIKEWRRCTRSEASLALILAGADHFGSYNSGYGYAKGDACLQAIAKTITEQLVRPQDVVARFVGDQFICLLPETPFAGAWRKAGAIEAAVRALGLVHEGSGVASVVTVSVGVVATEPVSGGEADSLLVAADEFLQQAKQAGRGCVAGEAI